MADTKKRLDLQSLEGGVEPGLHPAMGSMMAAAGSFCLHENAHTSGRSMLANFDSDPGATGTLQRQSHIYILDFADVTDQMKRSFNDTQMATEFGAYGIAILSLLELTDYTIVRQSKKGTGFDYWLGKRNDALFQEAARLEVSGILCGDSNKVRQRVRDKLKQTEAGNATLPKFVVVVEFGTPLTEVVHR